MINLITFFLTNLLCFSIVLEHYEYNDFIVMLFIINIIQSSFSLCFLGGNRFSLFKVFFIFSLLFMGVIPMINYINHVLFWGVLNIDDQYYIISLLLIIVSNFIFIFIYIRVRVNTNQSNNNDIKKLNYTFVIPLMCLSIFLAFYRVDFYIPRLFLKVEYDYVSSGPKAIKLIVNNLSMYIPLFLLLFVYSFERKINIKTGLIFLLVLLCAFPLGISRYAVASIYIPIILLINRKLYSSNLMNYIFIFGVLIIFPFLNQFRYFESGTLNNISFIPKLSVFSQGHFDAFQNYCYAISSGFITYGHQLIGNLLFFIPRAFWSSKPIGSGSQLALSENLNFSNISMPYIGEGFINFGIPGVIIYIIVLAFLLKKADFNFIFDNNISSNSIFYSFLLGYLFFFLRGDFLSSLAFFVSALVSFYLVKKLVLKP